MTASRGLSIRPVVVVVATSEATSTVVDDRVIHMGKRIGGRSGTTKTEITMTMRGTIRIGTKKIGSSGIGIETIEMEMWMT